VSVPRNDAAKVDGDEAAASPILVWNGLVARMRRASGEAERASCMDVESARQTPHDLPKSRNSDRESGS
jgi:hypothetical protein